MAPIILIKKFIVCPECKLREWSIQHLIDDLKGKKRRVNAGPWFCDQCGYGFTIAVARMPFGDRIDITVETHAERIYKEWVVVDIPPQKEPIRLVVRDTRSQPTITEEHIDHLRFRYEENTPLGDMFHRVERVEGDLQINPKFIKVCATQEEVVYLLCGED